MRFVAALGIILLPMLLFAQPNSHLASTTKVFSEEGKLQMTISYDPATRSRVYTDHYDNGKVYSKKTVKLVGDKELNDGEDITYYPSGAIRQYKLWKQGVPQGRAYVNYEDGKLEHEEFYQGNYKTGVWRYYSRTGELIKEIFFDQGKTPWNGKVNIAQEKQYSGGKLTYHGPSGAVKPKAKQKAPMRSPQTSANGKALFQSNCASCHAPFTDGAGPALAGVTRRRDNAWLTQMIKDGNVLLDLEDKEAQKVFRKWKAVRHPTFKKFTEQEIDALIAYLEVMQ